MKWLLIFFLPFGCFAQTLKPGLYQDLKPDKPIVLDTGSYTFIGLVFTPPHRGGQEGPWLDGSMASSLTLINCRFEGNGSGTAVATNGNAQISKSTFTNMKTGIQVLANEGTIRTLNISGNRFTDLNTAISLNRLGESENAILDFTLKCNQFRLTCAEEANIGINDPDPCAATGAPERRGLVIGEGVQVNTQDVSGVLPSQIGGVSAFDANNPLVANPNANEWPVFAHWSGENRATYPNGGTGDLQTYWWSPANWTSVSNLSDNPIVYYRYTNEFVNSVIQENADIFVGSPILVRGKSRIIHSMLVGLSLAW